MIYHEQTIALSNQTERSKHTQKKQYKEEVSCARARNSRKKRVLTGSDMAGDLKTVRIC